MSREESSALNCSGTAEGSSNNPRLDVADVPDRILEAINIARKLQHVDEVPLVENLAKEIEELLKPVLATMAAAAEELAAVT